MPDGELVPKSDNLYGDVGATTDQGDEAMEERYEDSEHGAVVCHGMHQHAEKS
jgi:hypothetical protein